MRFSAELYLRLFVGGVVSKPRFSHAIQQVQLTGGALSGNLYIDSKVAVMVGDEVMFNHQYVTQQAEAWLYSELPSRVLENVYLGPKGQLRLIFNGDFWLTARLDRKDLSSDGCWFLSCDQLDGYLSFDREEGYTYREKPLTMDDNQWWIDPVPEDLQAFLEQHPEAILLDPPDTGEDSPS